MHRVTVIDLEGQATPFRIHEDAYEALSTYLDQAKARLSDDPDGPEVLADLERSIGEKLAARRGPGDRILAIADVTAVIDEVGQVGGEAAAGATGAGAAAASIRPRNRRLYRIREGQSIFGVCTGIAAYSEIGLDWVRTIFVLGTIFTGGLLLLVYLLLAFILPVVPTRAAWAAEMNGAPQPS